MKTIFNNLSDTLDYLSKNDKSSENKVLNLSQCNFCFDLDLYELFFSLKESNYIFSHLSFKNSDFQNPVNLFLSNQQSIDFNLDFYKCHFLDTFEFRGVELCENLSFVDTIFEKNVEFSELVFKKGLRLSGASFHANLTFAHLELNNRSIFFTKIDDRTKFEGNLYFFNVVFNDARFWDFIFLHDVFFQNTIFNCPAQFNNSKFLGKTVLKSIETIGLTEFKNKVYFDNAEINDLNLINIVFDKVVSFNYATIKNISIENVHCYGFPLSLVGTNIGNVTNEGTARFLKSEAMKSNDPFLIADLNTKEMNMHYKKLRWRNRTEFFDKIILFFNKYSTNFGERWQQGVGFILLSWALSFSSMIMLRDGIGSTFIWFDKQYLKEALEFLWLFGSLKVLGDSYGLPEILIFILGKIFIVYGVYQTIAAFRKYGRK